MILIIIIIIMTLACSFNCSFYFFVKHPFSSLSYSMVLAYLFLHNYPWVRLIKVCIHYKLLFGRGELIRRGCDKSNNYGNLCKLDVTIKIAELQITYQICRARTD